MFTPKHTLCWDCANSTNSGCSWSDKFIPVKGWTAVRNEEKDSYQVMKCPLFERNSFDYGLKRMKEKENENEQTDHHRKPDKSA